MTRDETSGARGWNVVRLGSQKIITGATIMFIESVVVEDDREEETKRERGRQREGGAGGGLWSHVANFRKIPKLTSSWENAARGAASTILSLRH